MWFHCCVGRPKNEGRRETRFLSIRDPLIKYCVADEDTSFELSQGRPGLFLKCVSVQLSRWQCAYSSWLPWPWGARHLLRVLWITQFLSNYGFLFLPLLPWPSLCYMQFCVGIWSLETLESCVCLQAPERWGVWGLTFGSVFFPSDTLLLGFCHCFHFLLKHQRLGRVWGDVRRSSFMPDWLILIHMI